MILSPCVERHVLSIRLKHAVYCNSRVVHNLEIFSTKFFYLKQNPRNFISSKIIRPMVYDQKCHVIELYSTYKYELAFNYHNSVHISCCGYMHWWPIGNGCLLLENYVEAWRKLDAHTRFWCRNAWVAMQAPSKLHLDTSIHHQSNN